jgi:hypothetical protein
MNSGLFRKLYKNKNYSPEYVNIQNIRNIIVFNKLTFIKKKLVSRIAIRKNSQVNNIATTFGSTLIYSSLKNLDFPPNKLTLQSFSADDLKKIYGEFAKYSSNTIDIPEYTQILIIKDEKFLKLVENYQSIMEKYWNKTSSVPISSFDDFYKTALKSKDPMILKHFDQVIKNKEVVFVPKSFVYRSLYFGFRFVQAYGPLYHVVNTLNSARVLQISGRPWFESNPLLLITTPAVAAVALYSFGTMVGCDSKLGKVLTAGGDIMYLPMYFVELIFNNYATPIFIKTMGAPIVLNYTKTLKIGHGPGINYDDIKNYISDRKEIIIKLLEMLQKLKQSESGTMVLGEIIKTQKS